LLLAAEFFKQYALRARGNKIQLRPVAALRVKWREDAISYFLAGLVKPAAKIIYSNEAV
jgi:hypothetical protein